MNKYIQKFFLLFSLTLSFCSTGFALNNYQVEEQPLVIEQVIAIEQKGILKQKPNGYVYLDISDDFISEALNYIETNGEIIPTRDYTNRRGIGAHISVMYESEINDNRIEDIEELGEEFTFTIIEIRTVRLYKNHQTEKLWFIAVDSPDLEVLREQYGLSPLLNEYDFHITIGTEIPTYSYRIYALPFDDDENDGHQKAA